MKLGELYKSDNHTFLIIGAVEIDDAPMSFVTAINIQTRGIYQIKYITVEVTGNQYKKAIQQGAIGFLFEFYNSGDIISGFGEKCEFEKKINIKKYEIDILKRNISEKEHFERIESVEKRVKSYSIEYLNKCRDYLKQFQSGSIFIHNNRKLLLQGVRFSEVSSLYCNYLTVSYELQFEELKKCQFTGQVNRAAINYPSDVLSVEQFINWVDNLK